MRCTIALTAAMATVFTIAITAWLIIAFVAGFISSNVMIFGVLVFGSVTALMLNIVRLVQTIKTGDRGMLAVINDRVNQNER